MNNAKTTKKKIKMAGDMSTMVMKVEDDTIRLRYYYCHYYCYCYYYFFLNKDGIIENDKGRGL